MEDRAIGKRSDAHKRQCLNLCNMSVAPGLQRKLNKVLDQQKTESPEVWSKDLHALSAIYKENTVQNRRNIRTIIEKGLIESNKRFVEDAERIMASIDAVQNDLSLLGDLCGRMSSILSEGESQCSAVLDEINHAESSIVLTECRKEWLSMFQEKYQLPKDCAQILKDGVIGEAFLDALKRVQVIHSNCRSLGLSYHHKAGLELLDQLSTLQDEAFRHLCSWIQSQCQAIESPDNPEIGDMMPKAMKCLRSRPPLYSYCAEEIAMSRRTAVFQKFIQALSQGPRPIEMHAADPWRYANDMLAWIHSAIASEMELLGNLFEGCYSSNGLVARTDSLNMQLDGDSNADDATFLSLQEIMDTIFESVCRPLKLRLEQILMAAPSPVLNFQLTTLFGFYLTTIDPVMGKESQLLNTLRSCRSSADKSLRDQMKQRGERLVRQPPLPPEDLSMPEAYGDRLAVGVSIVKFHESSMLDDSSDENTHGLESLLGIIIDPIVESVLSGADILNPSSSGRLDDSGSHMNPSKQFIYILNCVCHVRSQFDMFDSTATLVDQLNSRINTSMNQLGLIQLKKILAGTHLEGCIGSLEERVNHSATLDIETAVSGASALWSRLQDPLLTIASAEYANITDQQVREGLEKSIVSDIVDIYTLAYHTASKSDQVSSIHRPEDVKMLLG